MKETNILVIYSLGRISSSLIWTFLSYHVVHLQKTTHSPASTLEVINSGEKILQIKLRKSIYLTKRHSTADPWSRTKLTRKPERWKKKANENKAKHFSTSERASRAASVDLSWWLLMEETFPSSVSATAGPRRFISGWVTVKSRGSVMASAAVGLFGSEACVQFTQCSRSYGGSCWIFIATCPCRPRVGIPNEKPHDITYYCRFFIFCLSFWKQTWWPSGESLSDHCIFWRLVCF